MKTSLFNRLYTYREREGKNAKENFLIELLAYALEINEEFRVGFIGLIGQLKSYIPEEFLVSTQVVYKQGRPDLELHLSNDCHVLIECKVESGEGEGQLDSYHRILGEKKVKHVQLVFLTKYYEDKGNRLIHIRWYQVIDLLKNIDRSELLNELLKYLIEEGMETKDFNLNDLNALSTIHQTISKMDEVLDQTGGGFTKEFGAKFKQKASRATALRAERFYGDKKYLGDSYFVIGFRARWGDNLPEVFAEFGLRKPSKKSVDEIKAFCNDLKCEYNENKNHHFVGRYQSLLFDIKEDKGILNSSILFLNSFLEDLKASQNQWKDFV